MSQPENSLPENEISSASKTKESIILNTVLAKYSSIWIWSIVVGINSALTYSFYNYRQSNWLALGILLSIFYAFAFLFCLWAWIRLAGFLRTIIIPLIQQSFISSDEQSVTAERSNLHFQALNHAFKLLIYALSCRFLAFILELIFSSLK